MGAVLMTQRGPHLSAVIMHQSDQHASCSHDTFRVDWRRHVLRGTMRSWSQGFSEMATSVKQLLEAANAVVPKVTPELRRAR